MALPKRPPFSSLPLDKTGPPGNAWGLYGKDDELGALNMITPETVLAASNEIQTGQRVSLDWSLNLPSWPSFKRPPFNWMLINRSHPDGTKRTVNDDELHINTQSSSQWDGFRHYGYQNAKRYYGGRTQEDVEGGDVIGIDRVADAGGITTRGILLDYPKFLKEREESVDAFSATAIPLEHLKEMLSKTRIETRAGDLLLLRTGFTEQYSKLGEEDRKALAERPVPKFLGVESTKGVLQWIWESGFAAVASDAPSFEMSPLVGKHNQPGGIWKGESWEEEMQGGGLVHQWCIGGWGVMIGEMWDLERLGEICERKGRWSFFVSSVPLKVPGGVASPPNAVAIF